MPPRSGSIRLLDLKAAPRGKDDAPLIGTLRLVSLVDRPAFATLSYTWGTRIPSGPRFWLTIQPQCLDLEISENCFQALRQIRSRVGAVTIWIDSVCMNQEGMAEKEFQIPLMQEIYSSACVGYIWLGGGSRESEIAISCPRWRARALRRLPLAVLAAPFNAKEHFGGKFTWRVWSNVFGEATRLLPLRTRI